MLEERHQFLITLPCPLNASAFATSGDCQHLVKKSAISNFLLTSDPTFVHEFQFATFCLFLFSVGAIAQE